MGNIRYENGIKPHGKGIQITFNWNGARHRPTLRIEPTKNNLKYATQLKGEIERAIALNTYTQEKYAEHFPTSQTAKSLQKQQQAAQTKSESSKFKNLAEVWLRTCSELSHGTLIQYNMALKFWVTHIGEENIEDIKLSTLAKLANSQGWSAKNRNNRLIPLRGIFELAYNDELIENDPTARLKNTRAQKKPCDPLSAEEVEMVLAHMKKTYDPQIANYFETAFFTGMRPSEMIALRWEDIDWLHGLVRVQRARTFQKEHETKTYTIRDVEMNQRALQALERQKQHTYMKNGYVFEDPVTNKPYHEDRPLRRVYWHPALRALKMRDRKFYQTRHTFASLNLLARANPMWVAEQLGHANMGMLLEIYGKWIKGADKSTECGKLDLLFTAKDATNLPQDEVQAA